MHPFEIVLSVPRLGMHTPHQKLPAAGPAREALRQKGQFWTPDWVAEAMVAYVTTGGSEHVFDPAVGAGAFFRATKTIAAESGRRFALLGTEIDKDALELARQNGLAEVDLAGVQITDFALRPPRGSFKAIVANPPYIRHHRLAGSVKRQLQELGAALIGTPLDGRAGLHIYFLLRALQLLAKDGRLAFIMPADTCEGIFATPLWNWITRNYRLEAVITFAPEASPFPGVDTNPIIFLIKNAEPATHLLWAKCTSAQTAQLKTWLGSDLQTAGDALAVYKRELAEGLSTGLSRAPSEEQAGGPTLLDFARVMRGIATGANEYFFLTVRQATELGLPAEFLVSALGRTRDVLDDEISPETLKALDSKGRPTLLFSPDGRASDLFPPAMQAYLARGESLGLPRKALIATRRPWYKMEVRSAPPILFAYLGRRNARFIRNRAGVVPLTGFLCIYPRRPDAAFVDRLWAVLRHPETVANLALVGKSYGSGAIKVEPRALERLPLSTIAVAQSGLEFDRTRNMRRTQPQTVQPFLPLQ